SPYSPTDRAAPTQTNGHDPYQRALSLSQCHSTDLSHQFAHPGPNYPTQHRPAVFGDPNQVVLEIVFRMTRGPIYLHTDVLPQGFAQRRGIFSHSQKETLKAESGLSLVSCLRKSATKFNSGQAGDSWREPESRN